jgi:hypothetical protein
MYVVSTDLSLSVNPRTDRRESADAGGPTGHTRSCREDGRRAKPAPSGPARKSPCRDAAVDVVVAAQFVDVRRQIFNPSYATDTRELPG